MEILGIETSCDETAAAVVQDGAQVLSNVVASQVDIHSRYGGIVPEVASRQHMLAMVPIFNRALYDAAVQPGDLDAIAVTYGPGLAGSLLIGVNFAKSLSLAWSLPLIGINHLEAHLYSNWLDGGTPRFPLVALVVSGGHTELVLMRDHGDIERLGGTRDDAAGEAFDKVARILGLGYPGGPAIEKAAHQGGSRIRLPRAWLRGSDDFSFSGLKTATLRLVERQGRSAGQTPVSAADIAAGFQESVVDVLTAKTIAAARRHRARQILLAGGVAANSFLRSTMVEKSPMEVRLPPVHLCTDNAAMVAACAHFHLRLGRLSTLSLDVEPGLGLA